MKPKNSPKPAGIRVLIVDDNPVILRGIASILADFPDLELAGISDTAGAISAIRSGRPDVAIVDVTLRGSQGLETVKACAYDPHTRIIALDLNSEPTYATRVIKNGGKGYVSKDPERSLADAVRRVYAGGLYVSDEVAQAMISTLTKHAGAGDGEPIESLSDRELEVAEYIGRGLSASQIAETMKLSIKTVETHKAHIKKKLGISKGSQLTRYCVTWFEQRNTRRTQ